MRVVVLSHNSLLADGIASRLSERPDQFDVWLVDIDRPEASDQLHAACPSIVIVDDTDRNMTEKISLAWLLEELPTAKVIRLNCESDQVQIISSEQRLAHHISELITMIQNIGPAPNQACHA